MRCYSDSKLYYRPWPEILSQSCLKLDNSFSFHMDAGINVLILPWIQSVVILVQLFITNSIWESFNWLYEISRVVRVDKVTKSGAVSEVRFLFLYFPSKACPAGFYCFYMWVEIFFYIEILCPFKFLGVDFFFSKSYSRRSLLGATKVFFINKNKFNIEVKNYKIIYIFFLFNILSVA